MFRYPFGVTRTEFVPSTAAHPFPNINCVNGRRSSHASPETRGIIPKHDNA